MMAFRILRAAASVITRQIATVFYSMILKMRLRLNGAKVGHGLKARGWVNLHIHRRGEVTIGDLCRINSGFRNNPVGCSNRMTIWVGKGGSLALRNNVGISNATIVCMNSITINDDVDIGGGARIYDSDFHALLPEARLGSPVKPINTGPIILGARCFIGGHAIILKNVTIGEEAIIGAGAVVSRNVPGGEIWAGNPARFIRLLRN